MKFGKFNIESVDTGIFGLDGGPMFGVVPKALWSKVYSPGDELNRIPLAARPLLVSWDNRKLLIDTGNGDKLSEKMANIYNIDLKNSSIALNLEKFGVKPDEITDVVLTHLHFDHCGGAVSRINDKLFPTFPNAKYYIQKDQLNWANNATEKDRASFIKDNYMPLLADGLSELLDGGGELFQNIELILAHGHTQAMQMVKIKQDDQTLLYCADLCPTSAHVPVPYVMGYDNFPLTCMDEKRKFMSQAYEEGWIVIYEHDAFRQASVINAIENRFFSGEEIKIS